MAKRIAIIGAGFSGLALARALADVADVVVFEKARGVGGRMSTRYADPFYFDHGAQFFTARSKAFQAFLAPHIASGTVAEWKGKTIIVEQGREPDKNLWFEPHYVAAPNMNSLCKQMAGECAVILNTEIAPLAERANGTWLLADKAGAELGSFDWVISTAPPVQTVRLFGSHLPATEALHNVVLQGCYALMVGFKKPWDRQWIAAKVRENPLQWIAVNSTKPGRNNAVTALVAHTANEWAEAHIDDDMDAAQAFLVQQFEALTGVDCSHADYLSTHRWRYALVRDAQQLAPFVDRALQIASVSDWCTASRVEDVWNNATVLAAMLRKHLA